MVNHIDAEQSQRIANSVLVDGNIYNEERHYRDTPYELALHPNDPKKAKLFSNPPDDQMKLFGYWEAHEVTGEKQTGLPVGGQAWYFTFGVEIEKNTIAVLPPNETQMWVGEYTYNDAISYKNVDIVWKQGGPKAKESKEGKTKATATNISYGILTASERSFQITFSKPGFAYRPVTMKPDPEMQVFLAKKLNFPEQIHLAYGKDPTTMITVSWVTTYSTSRTVVQYGLSSGNYQFQATGTWSEYKFKKYKSGAIHSVFITGLKPATKYYYRCGTTDEWSAEYSFETASPQPEVSLIVYGDLNLAGAWAGDHTFAESLSTIHYVNLKNPAVLY